MPVETGIQVILWIPAFAGMTESVLCVASFCAYHSQFIGLMWLLILNPEVWF